MDHVRRDRVCLFVYGHLVRGLVVAGSYKFTRKYSFHLLPAHLPVALNHGEPGQRDLTLYGLTLAGHGPRGPLEPFHSLEGLHNDAAQGVPDGLRHITRRFEDYGLHRPGLLVEDAEVGLGSLPVGVLLEVLRDLRSEAEDLGPVAEG